MAMTPDQSSQDESESYSPLARKFLWADSMKSVDKLIIGLAVLCALLFLMEFLWHRHTKVPGEQLIGFYPLAGFISFSLIVLGAKALRVFIARDESFYAPHGVDAEEYPLEGTERIPHSEKSNDSLASFKDELMGRGDSAATATATATATRESDS